MLMFCPQEPDAIHLGRLLRLDDERGWKVQTERDRERGQAHRIRAVIA